MKEKFIIISFDAVDRDDFEKMKNFKNFKELIKLSSYSSMVESVYPSITYPAHTTISTGLSPKNHGIVNNIKLQPRSHKPDWYWQRKYIKGETIYDLAKKKGLRTAALLWPVTGKSKTLDINVPEIFPNKPWQNQVMVSLLNGSKLFQYKINKLYGHLRSGVTQPNLDNFTFASLMHILKDDLADFILVHLTDVDTHKHIYGKNSKKAEEALKRHDERLGEVVNFLKSEGIYENSTLIALGDHSFKDAKYVVKLNKLFINKGLIKLDNKGRISTWDAYVNYCDGSAYVYIENENIKDKVYEILETFSNEHNNCIKSILSLDESDKLGANSECTFMLEASEDYYFINSIKGEIITETKGNHYIGTHGYDPRDPSYNTFFIAKGKNIKENHDIGEMHLLDEAPTIAKLLEMPMDQCEKSPLDIFK